MILAPRNHLYATNIVFFFLIFFLQKLIRIFCIIERKACDNINCTPGNRCEERCASVDEDDERDDDDDSSSTSSSHARGQGFSLVPSAMRKTMSNFGFGEGHYQIFVEEKQRKPYKAHLNTAAAEVKPNPN